MPGIGPSGGPASSAGGDWWSRVLDADEAHDHLNVTQHQGLSTPNFEVLGWDPLDGGSHGRTLVGNLCGDAAATTDGRRLAAVTSREDVSFTLADVTDPAHPRWLGEFKLPGVRTYDVAVVPDGKHVVVITAEVSNWTPTLAPRWQFRGACAPAWTTLAGPDATTTRASAYLVDVSDPRNPQVAQQIPLPGFGHGVSATRLDGRTWVSISTVCLPTPRGSPFGPLAVLPACQAQEQTWQFYELAATPAGDRLSPLGAFVLPLTEGASATTDIGSGHSDVWVAKHPVTNRTTAWLAAGDAGFVTVDLTDPRQPTMLGRWSDYDATKPGTGASHSVRVIPEAWEGRHYVLVGPEFGRKPGVLPSGVVRVLDDTDPTHLTEVAAWTLPSGRDWGKLEYLDSPHYLTSVNRTAFVAMYHGGVWALDLGNVSAGGWTLLDARGAFVPASLAPRPPPNPFRFTPSVEDVLAMPDGTLVCFDDVSGVYTLRFHEDVDVPRVASWPVAKAATHAT